MRIALRAVGIVVALCVLWAGAEAADSAPGIRPPDSIVVKNVPTIPAEVVEPLVPFENIRAATLADWDPAGRHLLILTRFAQATQLHEVKQPGGDRSQLTFYNEPVTEALYRPHHPAELVFGLDEGGAENTQLLLLNRHQGKNRRLSDGVHVYRTPLWSHSGQLLAYVSNRRNGRDFDLYLQDPDKAGSERLLAELSGSWAPLDWSPDDHRLLITETVSANDSSLEWIDVTSGERHPITHRAEGKKAAYEGGDWTLDGRAIYTTTDRDNENLRLVRLNLDGSVGKVLSVKEPWDVESFALSSDGTRIAYFTNEEGSSRLHLMNLTTGTALPVPTLPAGVAGNLLFRHGSHEVGFNLSWAQAPNDVYSYDLDGRHLSRWTASEMGGLDADSFPQPQLIRYPTFDKSEAGATRTIPAFVYRPSAGRFSGRRPVLISIHGGPEGQSRPSFLGAQSYYVAELGIAILVPNVRGSTGYGKTYLDSDNGMKREDTVRDIGALLDWIATQPDLDPSKVMVTGGSYGGYMVLSTMTHYSDRLACGAETVGISNFVTFLEHTQAYRRDLRRVEYGDERDPKMREFLHSISPTTNAEKIRRPLLVAAGANDPRVPYTEGEQIVQAVEKNGVQVWYVLAKDEGHGFQKRSNSDYLRATTIEFARHCLLGVKTEK
jgi:dipeptidyl aminopeptidase/acylaminoacyl peptidase